MAHKVLKEKRVIKEIKVMMVNPHMKSGKNKQEILIKPKLNSSHHLRVSKEKPVHKVQLVKMQQV